MYWKSARSSSLQLVMGVVGIMGSADAVADYGAVLGRSGPYRCGHGP